MIKNHLNFNVANVRYEEIDSAMLIWFCNARSRNIPINSTIIKEKALEISKIINQDSAFVASSGWLEKFLNRNNISHRSLSGEGASIDLSVVENWTSELQNKCLNYQPNDIYNIDETGLFYKQTPNKSYVRAGEESKGGVNSKMRLTVCLMSSWTGAKEQPIIIGNAKKPRCFGRIDVGKTYKIEWLHNKKAWMTAEMFREILEKFNRKMRLENRHVLLFLDNATSHPDIPLSNVKLVFLPPKTTSHLQPMDQGIIQSFKIKYRKLLVQHLLSGIDTNMNILNVNAENLPGITVLDAIIWIKTGWDAVSPETIMNCFRKSGFNWMNLISNQSTDTDCDFSNELQNVSNLLSCDEISVNDYLNFDNETGEPMKFFLLIQRIFE